MPAPDPAKTGPRPNPYRDSGPFGNIEIGGVDVPGVLQSITGLVAKQDWNFQKASGGQGSGAEANPDPANNGAGSGSSGSGGSGSSGSSGSSSTTATTVNNVEPTRNTGAGIQQQQPKSTSASASGGSAQTAGSFGVSVWRGALLAEEIEIVSDVSREEHYDAALDFIFVVMPKRGKKPPSLSLVNPDANIIGITRCAIREIGPPMEDPPGSGKRLFKFKICEYNPQKTAAAGKADPAKPGADPKPADAQEAELQKALDKARGT
jgi:hypothetical protein